MLKLMYQVIELLLDVKPDLPVLKVRVKLDHFHLLLFLRSDVMDVKANSVE